MISSNKIESYSNNIAFCSNRFYLGVPNTMLNRITRLAL
jgi:hypothetical protein